MEDNPQFLNNDEKIYWQGEPVVPVLNVNSIVFYILPSVILLIFWSGCIEYGENYAFLQKAYDFIHQGAMTQWGALLLIIGLMVYPVVRWFLYYKRIAYVFTDKRAVAYYKDSNEIDFQIEASGILNMQLSYRGGELVSLNTYTTEEGQDVEGRGVTRVVRTGFEGIPARILDFYRDTTN